MSSGWIRAPGLLVIDTIPLLLFLVGVYDPSYLRSFKRLNTYGYEEKHFEILNSFLLRTGRIAVTSSVLSEISNILQNDKHFLEILDLSMNFLMELDEMHIEKNKILSSGEFPKLAFTDTSILITAKDHRGSILTRDRGLWGACRGQEISALHLDDVLAMGDIIKRW